MSNIDPGPYTTDAQVRQVDPSIPKKAVLDIYIATAHELVFNVVRPSRPRTYSESSLALIEAWLSAHFYHVYDPQVSNEHAGPVSAGYQYHVEAYLLNTMFGQAAMTLDTNGALAALVDDMKNGKKPTNINWLGTPRRRM